MKLRKTIGKILALGTGAVMVGATILSAAAAADLKNYPDPFVKDGKFNAVLVVGDSAASSDVVGSIDVSNALQYASRVKKTIQSTGGGQVSLSGEAWRVGQGAKKLEFSERLDAGTQSSQQENVRNITTFIGKDELPNLLKDGTFSNTQGDYDYRQYIYFDSQPAAASTGNPVMLSVVYAEDPDNSKTGDYLFIDGQNGNNIARYSLEFTETAKTDITDSAGAISATGTFLWNFEGKSINFLGRDWSIVKARTDSTGHADVDLTLMGGATKDVLTEGDSKTYTIGGKDYEVTLDFVGSTTAKFTVNGEVTDSLQEGNTQTLKDGTQVGIRDIISQEFAGGVRKAEFYLGADKVRLRDTLAGSAAAAGEQTMEVGTETITGTKVTIVTGNSSSNSMTLSSIAINVTADQDYYIPSGGMLSKKLRKPQALLSSWDILYNGLDPVPTEKIKLTPSGSTQYYLEFADASGNNVKMPIAYTAGTTRLKMGDSDDDTVLIENQTVTKNDYLVITDSTQQRGQRKTYGLRYLSSIGSGESSPKIEFQNLGSGGTESVDYKAQAGYPGVGTEDATLKLGGGTFKIWNNSLDTNSNFQLKIDLDGDGTLESAGTFENQVADNGKVINVTSKGGGQISLTFHPVNYTANASASGTVDSDNYAGSLIFSLQTLDADDYDNVAPSAVEFNISAASAKVDIAEHTVATNLKYITPSADTNLRQTYTSLGTYIDWRTVSNDPDSLIIESPVKSQRLPIVVVSGPGATVTKSEASEAGQIVYYETSPIEVGTAKLATEVADITAQNSIVVGGPCANAAAATLMGNPANCAEGFTEGKAMVKLVENANGKVALLVAGASAMDTRRAARVLADYAKWQEKGVLKGMEVEVAGTSFTDITVGAPVPKVVAPAPVVEAPAAAPAATP
ncbi:S-layer protein [Candidatus Woesearchaeota archaeon]|nr:S-layer protein [Candidatus Woesearchaeota archaeon]